MTIELLDIFWKFVSVTLNNGSRNDIFLSIPSKSCGSLVWIYTGISKIKIK